MQSTKGLLVKLLNEALILTSSFSFISKLGSLLDKRILKQIIPPQLGVIVYNTRTVDVLTLGTYNLKIETIKVQHSYLGFNKQSLGI